MTLSWKSTPLSHFSSTFLEQVDSPHSFPLNEMGNNKQTDTDGCQCGDDDDGEQDYKNIQFI